MTNNFFSPLSFVTVFGSEIRDPEWIKKPRSGMFIPDPGYWFLPIPDPGSKNSNKREGWKKIWCHTFLCSHKFHKIVHYFSFEVLKKKIWANFQRIIELLPKKLSLSSQKYGFGIRDPEKTYSGSRIPDLGVKKAPDPGSGSATLKTRQS